jgi:hypothetical protein
MHGLEVPSTVIANLLDDGVADTLGVVGAMCGVHADVPINDSDSARILHHIVWPRFYPKPELYLVVRKQA